LSQTHALLPQYFDIAFVAYVMVNGIGLGPGSIFISASLQRLHHTLTLIGPCIHRLRGNVVLNGIGSVFMTGVGWERWS